MAEASGCCVTVRVKPEGCEILILVEDAISPEELWAKIQNGLLAEYRYISDVTHWVFHGLDQAVVPGMFKHCTTPGLEAWVLRQAAIAFGWETSTMQQVL